MLVYLVIYEHLATICIGLSDPYLLNPGAAPGFQVRGGGGALKKICAERRKVFGVKNHDFTPKNHIFFQF